jgi:6-phospho-beta-glucosidase
MKLVIVGGGSSYTPELVGGFIEHYTELPFDEICLTDIDAHRLNILQGLSKRMLDKAGLDVRVTSTTDKRSALLNADFVNCLIRVGGMDARINDERIPIKYGVVGQETTGPGGMMKALRTIPVILELAHEIETICPEAWLINYTNPSGIIAEALGKYSKAKWIGLCSGPNDWSKKILDAMEVDHRRASVDWMGLNHLGFAVRVWVDGEDRTEQAVKAIAQKWSVDDEWLQTLGFIPATYLRYYYHHHSVVTEMVAEDYKTRGEQVQEIEAELLRQYTDTGLADKPALLKQRGGGGYADTAFAAMRAIYRNSSERQVLQVLNKGGIDGISADASVEIPCLLDKSGPHPLQMGEIPLPIRGLIQSVKCYESLTVQAAVEGSRKIALQALMAHPFVSDWKVAKPMMEELLTANQKWLPWVK